jgi:hypothetical protein
MNISRYYWVLATAFVAGCTAIGAMQFEQQFGPAEPRERAVETLSPSSIDYWTEVKPIVENRCVVCHACYDAPCQLKMNSIEGIERGATKTKVYHSTRLKAAPMTRIFEDAQSVAEWREMDFYPVLNERDRTPEANRQASVMYRMLQLKEAHPLPDQNQLPKQFDLSLDRKQFCPKPEEFNRFTARNPLWGMPYALPGLPSNEQNTLKRWVEQGAPYLAREPLAPVYREQIDRWEQFLNGDSLKQRLMSRYIYEHLSYAHLYFSEIDTLKFFRVVRSATPPGEPVQLIATRRPYDDPGVERAYYRIEEQLGSIVVKTHMPYRLDPARMRRWQSLFIDAEYEVTALPSYEEKYASNPFITFNELPVGSRYRFMLDEAQYTIMGFIKGSVCRGQVALNVINDNFWVFFVNPDVFKADLLQELLFGHEEYLQLPASTKNIFRPIAHWRRFAEQQRAFLAAKDQILEENRDKFGPITLDWIWDGDGDNQNAALTVFRNFDSATVEKGMVGQKPKTAWVIGYTLLERIHYLLVAGYDVFGNLGHQLVTRSYMDFLRMEGESNFLLFLPESARIRERNYWYREADDEVMSFVSLPNFEAETEPDIIFQTDDEKSEFFGMLAEHLEKVLPVRHSMAAITNDSVRTELDRLHELVGTPVTLMPEIAFVRIHGTFGEQYITLLSNNAHLNMTSIFAEQKNREPDKDVLSVIPGLVGAYPNAFYEVEEYALSAFVDSIANLQTEADYAAMLDSYGIRRTHPDFWQYSDKFQQAVQHQDPLTAGVLDYNRLENR